MDEANALVLQHLRSLNVREDLARQLQEELEAARVSAPRVTQESSLVRLVYEASALDRERTVASQHSAVSHVSAPPCLEAGGAGSGSEALERASGRPTSASSGGTAPLGSARSGKAGPGAGAPRSRTTSISVDEEPPLPASPPLAMEGAAPASSLSGGSTMGESDMRQEVTETLKPEASDLIRAEATRESTCVTDDCSGDGGVFWPPSSALDTIAIPPDTMRPGAGEDSEELGAEVLGPSALIADRGLDEHVSAVPVGHQEEAASGRSDSGRGVSMQSFFGDAVGFFFPPDMQCGEYGRQQRIQAPQAQRANSAPQPRSRPPLWGPSVLPTRPAVSVPVTLHVYDLGASGGCRTLNKVLGLVGAGVFHCGVEVYDREWSFRKCVEGTGVFSCRPRCCNGQSFAESVLMGQTVLPKCDVFRLVTALSKKWLGSDYNILTRNCCHFCKELCRLLSVGPVPDRIMAAAAAGEYLETTSMSYRSVLLGKIRERTCCSTMCPEVDVEDVPESVPTLALPSNTASPSQAMPVQMQQHLMAEYHRSSTILNL